jgi:addiction module HigA family antidote
MRLLHPGKILREHPAVPGLSANALASGLHVPTNRITSIMNEQRSIRADTALRLARYFGTTPEFWMHLQSTYDLKWAELKGGERIAREVRMRAT